MLEDPDGDETGHEWQWMVADTAVDDATRTDIDGATSATFTPRDRDLGDFLSVKVKYTDDKGKDEATGAFGAADNAVAVAASAAPRFYKTRPSMTDDANVVTKFELKLPENTGPSLPARAKMSGSIYSSVTGTDAPIHHPAGTPWVVRMAQSLQG